MCHLVLLTITLCAEALFLFYLWYRVSPMVM